MAFLDVNAASPFATRRPGVTLRIHADWYAMADEPAPAPMSRWRKLAAIASGAVTAVGVHLWVAEVLSSQLLGVAATGVIAAIAISLFSVSRR
ncbi:hypothetical protein ACFOMD_06350 [Sphingoaurantiacus capsulatus]|uniref:Uncharacterized protein n=1 Tax=Sphingoaurantiacus capsulatus TaxID=1771310 RepID=A0ABV7X8L3_9SPHN